MAKSKIIWRLTWAGEADTPCLRAAVQHLNTFPLFANSGAKLITQKEYMILVLAGKIKKPESYWGIEEGKIGLISKEAYSKYVVTWDKINTAWADFRDGWAKCAEHYRIDEANPPKRMVRVDVADLNRAMERYRKEQKT